MSHRGLVVVALTKAKHGQEERLKRRLASLLGLSRSEPGCLEFRVHQGLADRALFISYEVWADSQAFQNHLQMPYMKVFMAEAPQLVEELEPTELRRLGIASNPDISQWRRIGPERAARPGQKGVVVVGRIQAKAGKEAELKQALLAVLGLTRDETACLRFELEQGADDPSRFLAYQWWTSAEQDAAHYQHSYMQDFQSKSPGLLERDPIILMWEEIEPEGESPEHKGNGMESHDDTVIKALHQIANPLQTIATLLGAKIPGGTPGWSDVPQAAFGDKTGREEVLVRYTVGTGTFSADKRFSALNSTMYKMNGEEDGTFVGVWKPLLDPSLWFNRPDPPEKPFNEPVGPCPSVDPRAYTKAIWTFGDAEKSSVTGVGPAFLHLVPLPGGDTIFLVSVAGVITNGTGKYKHAYGVKTALGATLPDPGVDMFNLKEGQTFPAVTVETFRIIAHPKHPHHGGGGQGQHS